MKGRMTILYDALCQIDPKLEQAARATYRAAGMPALWLLLSRHLPPGTVLGLQRMVREANRTIKQRQARTVDAVIAARRAEFSKHSL